MKEIVKTLSEMLVDVDKKLEPLIRERTKIVRALDILDPIGRKERTSLQPEVPMLDIQEAFPPSQAKEAAAGGKKKARVFPLPVSPPALRNYLKVLFSSHPGTNYCSSELLTLAQCVGYTAASMPLLNSVLTTMLKAKEIKINCGLYSYNPKKKKKTR